MDRKRIAGQPNVEALIFRLRVCRPVGASHNVGVIFETQNHGTIGFLPCRQYHAAWELQYIDTTTFNATISKPSLFLAQIHKVTLANL
jgi:hypothetical protein